MKILKPLAVILLVLLLSPAMVLFVAAWYLSLNWCACCVSAAAGWRTGRKAAEEMEP